MWVCGYVRVLTAYPLLFAYQSLLIGLPSTILIRNLSIFQPVMPNTRPLSKIETPIRRRALQPARTHTRPHEHTERRE